MNLKYRIDNNITRKTKREVEGLIRYGYHVLGIGEIHGRYKSDY